MSTPITTQPGTNSADELKPFRYEPEHIPLMWEQFEPLIEKALEYDTGTMTPGSIYELLADGRATAFATVKEHRIQLLMVVCFVNYATYRAARIIAMAGENFLPAHGFLFMIESWAIAHGATKLEGWCRPEVVRVLSLLGWTTKTTIVEKDLKGKLQ